MQRRSSNLNPSPSNTRGKSLTQDVQETILAWIRDRKYPAGSQLPSMPELVRQLQVSRTVVREALQSIAGMNLIEIRPGLGCFVNSVSPDLVLNADVLASLLDQEAIEEVASARQVIEGGIARLAAITATEEDFEEMEEVLRRIKRAAKRNQPLYAITPLFHIAMARATHNMVLEKVVLSFNLLMASGGALIEKDKSAPQDALAEYESHRRLYQALRTRDPDKAQHAVEKHIGVTVDELKKISIRGPAVRAS